MTELNNLAIRRLTIEDIDSLCLIENLSFPTPWTRESYQHELAENPLSIFVGCFEGDRLLSFGGFWKILDEAHITNVAVHPDFRGQGIGEFTMRNLMIAAMQEDCRWMTLEVRVSNLTAQGLYKKLGFKVAGERPHYYENDEAAVIMWLQLN
ncbi:MAG: ribosomal protein S18-alanine N-acetyltransferase [Firmicutes bacterium]|nr:ribosomal protein S18-alanine N-acetyltransferase [Bacillota bacterium]